MRPSAPSPRRRAIVGWAPCPVPEPGDCRHRPSRAPETTHESRPLPERFEGLAWLGIPVARWVVFLRITIRCSSRCGSRRRSSGAG